MEVAMKRRYATMMAAVLETEDDDAYFVSRKRSCWVKGWMQEKSLGIQHQLYDCLLKQDPDEYRRLLRMPHDVFERVLASVRPHIEKGDTNMRLAVSARTRLQLTLRYLASGESQYSLSRQFRVGHSTVNTIIASTCEAIYIALKKELIKSPTTEEAWTTIARGFGERWNFPTCVGGIDGKHVAIVKPAKSGSVYFNYKKTYSIILFALVDHNCKFLYIDVGAPGSQGDGSIWQTTPLQRAIARKKAGLPAFIDVPGQANLLLPPAIVGDDAFPLSPNLMKPFGGTQLSSAQKIFNYRLSRARRVTENAFGILAHRFRFLLTRVHAKPERATAMVQAACVLHNLLQGDNVEVPELNSTPDRQVFFNLQHDKSRSTALAAAVRERLCDYFCGDGAVSWQDTYAGVDVTKLRHPTT
ncbi:putative nuclease HARBI1 [Rhipicephalus sanguineus]|uniref:putative nuclease HARBI1 n=1 Tax=Rhipicephalus sanguineus TaxID=34632 RepID=UPI0020C34381|nr:putative nuclease HARBI1 [Rhipicephalus sanguineus]